MTGRTTLAALAASLLLSACGLAALAPDKPVRPTQYDFGPIASALPNAPATPATGSPLVLGDVEVSGSLEGSAMVYRLAYADPHQLRPYAFARWSAPPGQLVRQRLREHLGRDRPVIDSPAATALARRAGQAPRVLRVELEEFSHVFDTEKESRGFVRLRCTVLENTAAGERLLAQRSFSVERPAPTADASGGVRALTAALDAAAQDIAGWLRQQP
jgi:cholesterol transport system auxiliary component